MVKDPELPQAASVGCRCGSALLLLGCGVGWQLQLQFGNILAQEPPYAVVVALKRRKKKVDYFRQKSESRTLSEFFLLPDHHHETAPTLFPHLPSHLPSPVFAQQSLISLENHLRT